MSLTEIFLDTLEKIFLHLETGNSTSFNRWPFAVILKAKMDLEKRREGILELTLALLAKLTNADKRASREELYAIEDFLEYGLGLSVPQKTIALELFRKGRASTRTFEDLAVEYRERYGRHKVLLEHLIDLMVSLALVDAEMSQEEERLINHAAATFGIDRTDFDRIVGRHTDFDDYRESLRDNAREQRTQRGRNRRNKSEERAEAQAGVYEGYYRILGCRKGDSITVVKKRYRKLVLQYHPDRLAGKGLPEEMLKFSTERFRRIQEAYDQIRTEMAEN